MFKVIMPKLGVVMESGIMGQWHKKEGDKVEEGDILFEVTTDKVTMEIEAYKSGILRKIVRHEGEEVPVNGIVAYIGEKDEEIPEEEDTAQVESLPENETLHDKSPDFAEKIDSDKGTKKDSDREAESKRIKISPLAKKIAREKNIDVSKIKGADPGGRITKEDVLSFIDSKESAGTAEKKNGINIKSSNPLTGIAKVVAERMSESKKEIPHTSLRIKVDATNLVNTREQIKDRFEKIHNVRITYTDFIIKACAVALVENIELNSSYLNSNFIIYEDINIGIAVAVDDNLIVPTIYRCNEMSLVEIAKKRSELVTKAREEKLVLDEITNGTFTITNLGMLGIRSSVPIINPPQAGIIAIGEIYNEPSLVSGEVVLRYFMEITLSCDHRIINGNRAALFLKSLKRGIENPLELIV